LLSTEVSIVHRADQHGRDKQDQYDCASDEQYLIPIHQAIDLLEPNVWLELDEVSFPRFFDGPLRRDSDALVAAKAFAEQHGAVLVFQTNPRVAKFGRAYVKRDTDA
jgi:hypothetical protein